VDFGVIEQCVLCEWQRQGVEFARVMALENFSDAHTTHITIETMRTSNQRKRRAQEAGNGPDNPKQW
jgi:hypothetical protein